MDAGRQSAYHQNKNNVKRCTNGRTAADTIGARLMVGLQILALPIGVRIPGPELDLENRLKIVCFSF